MPRQSAFDMKLPTEYSGGKTADQEYTGQNNMTIREQLDAHVKEKYGIDPEILPFSKEDYGVYRHPDTGKWFAVFIVKERSAFGLPGSGEAEVVSFKIRDRMLSDFLMQQPGYLRGFPASNWNWTSAVLDGAIPFEDICRWVDESYAATKTKTKNKRTPLPKIEQSRKDG